jgi:hypothetical protein
MTLLAALVGSDSRVFAADSRGTFEDPLALPSSGGSVRTF